MGLFDYALNNFSPYQGGLLGALAANNQGGIAQNYGGYKKPDPFDIPGIEPQFSPDVGVQPPAMRGNDKDNVNPLMALWGALNARPTTPGFLGESPAAPPDGAWLRSASPQQPLSSGAEPSAVWGGPAPQPPAQQGTGQPMPPQTAQAGTFGGPGLPQSAMGGGAGGGVFPPGSALPPNAAPAQGQAPQMQPQAAPSFNPLTALGGGLQEIAAGFSPGIRAENRPQLQETGTDPFTGQKNFAWVNPQKQTMTPATMGGQPSSQSSGMGQFAEAMRSGVAGQKLMESAPPEIKNRLQAMLEGREAPPSQAALRNPQVQAMLNAAHAIDPTFDETAWGKRFALIKNYQSGGKQFQEVQALNTVSGHLVNLMNTADALNNTSIPIVNGVMNWIRQNTGDPRVDKLNTDIQAVSTELSKAYKAGHVSDADVRAWRENINSAKSPEQFKAVIGELNDLLRSKKEAIDEGFRGGMGKTPLPQEYNSESERAKKNFDAVVDWSMGGKRPQAASGGWTVKKVQ